MGAGWSLSSPLWVRLELTTFRLTIVQALPARVAAIRPSRAKLGIASKACDKTALPIELPRNRNDRTRTCDLVIPNHACSPNCTTFRNSCSSLTFQGSYVFVFGIRGSANFLIPSFILFNCFPFREVLRAGFEPSISGLRDLRRSQFA